MEGSWRVGDLSARFSQLRSTWTAKWKHRALTTGRHLSLRHCVTGFIATWGERSIDFTLRASWTLVRPFSFSELSPLTTYLINSLPPPRSIYQMSETSIRSFTDLFILFRLFFLSSRLPSLARRNLSLSRYLSLSLLVSNAPWKVPKRISSALAKRNAFT